MGMTGPIVRTLCGLEACPSSPLKNKEEQMLLCSRFFWSLRSFCVFYYPRRVTLTLETVTTIFELHQSFLSCPLRSEGEGMGGISLDQGKRERKKRGRQMMD